jgi:hypothetical protein
MRLTVRNEISAELLATPAAELYRQLPGPTLFELPGRREPALFVSVLLHGNEYTGWDAIREFLGEYGANDLPRRVSLLVGNVAAARHGRRRLDDQPDFNRIWTAGNTPVHPLAAEVLARIEADTPLLAIDIHNNTGLNPHYSCVNVLRPMELFLAAQFTRTVVYFTRPETVLSMAFNRFCPAIILECGKPGDEHGLHRAKHFVRYCLELDALPDQKIAASDIDLFHTVATVKIPDNVDFGFDDEPGRLRLLSEFEGLNFRELPADTLFAHLADKASSEIPLAVSDQHGECVAARYFRLHDGEIRTLVPLIPSMYTLDENVIRQDCLCYLMEHYPWG